MMWKPGRPRIGLRRPVQVAGAARSAAAAAIKTASLLEVLQRHPWILPETAAEEEAALAKEESPYSSSAGTAVVLPDAGLQLRANSCSSDGQSSQPLNTPVDAPTSAKAPAAKPQLRSMPKLKTVITKSQDTNSNQAPPPQQQLEQEEKIAACAAASLPLLQATPSAPEMSSPADQGQPCSISTLPISSKQAEQQLQLPELPVPTSSEQQCDDDWDLLHTTAAWTEGQLLGGRFRIIHQLGRGGFATVYKTVDIYSNREVGSVEPRPLVV